MKESFPQPVKKEETRKTPEKNIADLAKLLEGRDIFTTKEVLVDILAHTDEENLREVASLLASNEKMISKSAIARGDTSDGHGIGQAMLKGSVENPLVQVYITKGSNEPVNIFAGKYKFVPFEEDRENFNRTVLHELLHSFTRYIVATHDMEKEDLLTEMENNFYASALAFHKEFLKNYTTGDSYLDSLDEYIAKAMTSNLADNGSFNRTEYNKVYGEFQKLYKENTRQIESISVKVAETKK